MQSLTKKDFLFLLSLRSVSAKTKDSVAALKEKLVPFAITEEERQKLTSFKNIPKEVYDQYEAQGWFNKTYKTAKDNVLFYLKTNHPNYPPYNLGSEAEDNKKKIAQMLYFYKLFNINIRLEKLELTNEQKDTIAQKDGIIVVNSGPGTGKTTVAVYKALDIINQTKGEEGVIIVSYTNTTVDNFTERLKKIVVNVEDVSQKPGKKIYVCTVDSLARKILPEQITNRSKRDFNLLIKQAVNMIEKGAPIFQTLDGKARYKHIIIDEAQDVDEDRFNLLKAIYYKWNFKGMTIIGDPRQRLDIQAGSKYQELIDTANGTRTSLSENNFVASKICNYTTTFRFENPSLLELCNKLSSRRQAIHVPLETGLQSSYPEEKIVVFSEFKQVCEFIQQLLDNEVHPNEIAIVSPSIQKSNSAGDNIKKINSYLASKSILTSNEITKNTIYITSIQGIKGLEFDYVIFAGAGGYPSTYSTVYADVNDGESMNFVVNTRARKRMAYLSNSTLEIPIGVPETMTIGGKASVIKFETIPPRIAIRTDEIETSNIRKFEQSNVFPLFVEKNSIEIDRTSTSVNFAPLGGVLKNDYMYETISALICKLKGGNSFQYGRRIKNG